jgi:hypothetical protein
MHISCGAERASNRFPYTLPTGGRRIASRWTGSPYNMHCGIRCLFHKVSERLSHS